MSNLVYLIIEELGFVGLSIGLLWLAKIVRDLISPIKLDNELNKSNLAAIIAIAGYFAGITAVLIGAFLGPSKGLRHDILNFLGYGVLGIVLMNISAWVNDKLILYKFCDIKEICVDRNVGTGMVHFGAYLASGLIIAGAIHGEGGGVHTALVFYLLGQVALILFTWVYDKITPYNLHEEIEIDNVAVGTAFGGTFVALGLILMKGTMGNFLSWQSNLCQFGTYTLVAIVLLPLLRLIYDKIFIPKTNLNEAVTSEQNIAAGVLEMVFAICIVLLFFFMLDLGCKL